MARLNVLESENVHAGEIEKQLDELIPIYAANKLELDSYTKLCKDENSQIKKLMAELNTEYEGKYATGKYKASYSISKRETMNEDILLDIAHKYNIEVIKTKEYIDYDKLESLIYNGNLSKDILLEMNKAKEVKIVETLRVSEIKKKKGE